MFPSEINFLSIVCILLYFTAKSVAESERVESKFRILAPQFICPKDDNATVEKPDNTVITLQTAADADMRIDWIVRWSPLAAPTQRFVLLLWRAVRALEARLNRPQPEPYVYVIENSQLLKGVNYIFNVSSVEANGDVGEPKVFSIDHTQGDHELMIDGRNDMLSIVILGGQVALADAVYVVEAQVTTCTPTQDYYFSWTVRGIGPGDMVNVSHIQGSRLEVPPLTLKVGQSYSATCQVIAQSTENLITKTYLPFRVQSRGLKVYLNVDSLRVTVGQPFTIESTIINHDYYEESVTYKWTCTFNGEDCNSELAEVNLEAETLTFPSGLPYLGEYQITLSVSVLSQTSFANASIITVSALLLPAIQLNPLVRMLNEGSTVEVIANASNVVPTCNLSWYFASEMYLAKLNTESNDTCDDCQHGEILSDTLTVYSLEEQFLSELSDFSNETEWRQVTATFLAQPGRARFVAQCGCSLTFSCDTEGTVFADVWFQLNESPKAGDVMISPESGTAMETEFRISTLPVVDPDGPLEYSFYCKIGDENLLLASYVEHRAVETFLPYIEGGTEVWVQVCDALGACSRGSSTTVKLTRGSARTVEALVEDVEAHVRRCEMTLLTRIAQAAIITYTNAEQSAALTKFSRALQKYLAAIDEQNCIVKHYSDYSALLSWMAKNGIETSELLYAS